MATSGDILLATREDFFMATDNRARELREGMGHTLAQLKAAAEATVAPGSDR